MRIQVSAAIFFLMLLASAMLMPLATNDATLDAQEPEAQAKPTAAQVLMQKYLDGEIKVSADFAMHDDPQLGEYVIRSHYSEDEYKHSILQVIGRADSRDLIVEELLPEGLVIARKLDRYNKYAGVMHRPEYSFNGSANVQAVWVGLPGEQAQKLKFEAKSINSSDRDEISRAPAEVLDEGYELEIEGTKFLTHSLTVGESQIQWSESFPFDGVIERSLDGVSITTLDIGDDAKPLLDWTDSSVEAIGFERSRPYFPIHRDAKAGQYWTREIRVDDASISETWKVAFVNDDYVVVEHDPSSANDTEFGAGYVRHAYVLSRYGNEAKGNLVAKYDHGVQYTDGPKSFVRWTRAALELEPKRSPAQPEISAHIIDEGMMSAAGKLWRTEDETLSSAIGSLHNVYAVDGWFDRLIYSRVKSASTELEIKLTSFGTDAKPDRDWSTLPGLVKPEISEASIQDMKKLLDGEVVLESMMPLHEDARLGDMWRARIGGGDDSRILTWRVVAQKGYGRFTVEVERGDGLVIAYDAGGFSLEEDADAGNVWVGYRGSAPTKLKTDMFGKKLHSMLNPGYDHEMMMSAAELGFSDPLVLAGRTWEVDTWTIAGTSIFLGHGAWFDGVVRVRKGDAPAYELIEMGNYPTAMPALDWESDNPNQRGPDRR